MSSRFESLPSEFKEIVSQQLGKYFSEFSDAFNDSAPTSIRLNTSKIRELPFSNAQKIEWAQDGYYLDARPSFTLDPLFHGGAYYVQEASSMILEEFIKQLDIPDKPIVLDLCAAPGGKSTHLSSIIDNNGLLVCNEVIRSRADILTYNMTKWGFPNVLVSNNDPSTFEKLAGLFDLILVDAPCSGEGLFRKDAKASEHWSLSAVQTCSARQKRILHSAETALSKNGFLVYSTCTYNDKENMANVLWMQEELNLKSLPFRDIERFGLVEKSQKGCFGYQCYPHRVNGEGFFISILTKSEGVPFKIPSDKKKTKSIDTPVDQWIDIPFEYIQTYDQNKQICIIPAEYEHIFRHLNKVMRVKKMGTSIGTKIKNKLIPSHDLAMSNLLKFSYPKTSLNRDQALGFLKKEKVEIETSHIGWNAVIFEGLPLGWIKNIGKRYNNYFPSTQRILMR